MSDYERMQNALATKRAQLHQVEDEIAVLEAALRLVERDAAIRALIPAATTGERPKCRLGCDGYDTDGRMCVYPDCATIVSEPPAEPSGAIYPCDRCGKLRTKAEGGTVFAVCDACWDATVATPSGATCKNPDCVDGRVPGELRFSDPCPDCATPSPARPSEAVCNDCKGASEYVKARCMTCGGTGKAAP